MVREQQKTEAQGPYLPTLRSPDDLKALPRAALDGLCRELRDTMIERTEQNGGHLASNLGVVELTVAIHRVFDVPTDHIIFDVGHQSYVHKLLTGRYDRFDTLRQPGGLSGFPRRDESPCDAFGTGHASTSLSAALGFARAEQLRGSDAYTVVVLGDGALTGGMIHEALNNCKRDLRLIVILNENEMSISKNTGRMAGLLTGLRTARGYSGTKNWLERCLRHLPLVGRPLLRGLRGLKNRTKRLLYRSNYFEQMGLNYYGPADGHDEETIERLLRIAKSKGCCSLIHLRTIKGKGYEAAERDPGTYHGLCPAGCAKPAGETFSQTFGRTLTDLAVCDKNILAITAAMCTGTGLEPFRAAHPTRLFDVGIAEEHAVTFAAGLAAAGMHPVVAVYSTFLQRSYDQILHDVALQGLPVLFAVDRAGLNAADGPTHHGIYDVAFLSHIPGVDIYEPATTAALERLIRRLAQEGIDHPTAVRYPSGYDKARIVEHFEQGATWSLCEGARADFDPATPPRVVAVTYGRLTDSVLVAAEGRQDVGVVLLEQLRPWGATADALAALGAAGTDKLVLCEEGIRTGGLAMSLATELTARGVSAAVHILAIDDRAGKIAEPTVGQSAAEAVGLGVEDIRAALT